MFLVPNPSAKGQWQGWGWLLRTLDIQWCSIRGMLPSVRVQPPDRMPAGITHAAHPGWPAPPAGKPLASCA